MTGAALLAGAAGAAVGWGLVPLIAGLPELRLTWPWRLAGEQRWPPFAVAATALAFAATALRRGWQPGLLPLLVLESVLVVAVGTDLRVRRIPDQLVLGGAGAGALALLPLPEAWWWRELVGGVLLFGLAYLVWWASRGGLGGGDVKLAGVIGFLLGPGPGMVAFVAAFLAAGMAGGVLLALGRKGTDRFPFAPYLAMGALVGVFYGNSIVHWYLVHLL
jgi:prepilin signal peptidase PulO-like enzyme (type II secretory pathway)